MLNSLLYSSSLRIVTTFLKSSITYGSFLYFISLSLKTKVNSYSRQLPSFGCGQVISSITKHHFEFHLTLRLLLFQFESNMSNNRLLCFSLLKAVLFRYSFLHILKRETYRFTIIILNFKCCYLSITLLNELN